MSRKVWTRQPEIGARINHASPLSRGLVFAMPDVGSGVDAVGPRVEPSDTGTVTRVATPAGRGVSSYGGIRSIPNPNGSLKLYTGPVTHAFVARLTNLDAWGGIFTVRDVSSANTCAGLTRRSSSDDLSFSRDSATELTIPGAAPAVANGLMQPVVVVSTGLGASDPTYLYVGSTKYTSATGSASAPSYSAVALVLYASRWYGAAEGVDGEYVSHFTWNRALTDAEARAFIANPWQLFAARNEPTYFLGPAAGGSTYDVNLSESASASDTFAAAAVLAGALSEAASASDVVAAAVVFASSLAESATADDAVSAALAREGALSESVTAIDAVTSAATLAAELSEAASASDAVASAAEYPASLSESVNAGDTIEGSIGAAIYAAELLESVSASDEWTAAAVLAAALVEAVTTQDAVTSAAVLGAILSEAASASDSVAAAAVLRSIVGPAANRRIQ